MAVKLNQSGFSHAKSLINSGKVDQNSAWSISAADEDKLLSNPPNWTVYASWHLGSDDSQNKQTKGAWKYPFGKDGKVFRFAVAAIRQRASQQGATDIFDAAGTLMGMLDKKKGNAMKNWYQIRAQADGVLEIDIFDVIGSYGIDFIAFAKALDSHPNVKNINLRINSPGGSLDDGIAIYNLLRQHPANKQAIIYGVANSAATLPAMAANPVIMPENTSMFIHEPMLGILGLFHGDALREMADFVDMSTPKLISVYARKTGLTAEKISELLKAGNTIKGTLLTAQEAKDLGFADEISQPIKLAARFDASRLQGIPQLEGLLDKFTFDQDPNPESVPDPIPEPNPIPEPALQPVTDPEVIRAKAVEEANRTAHEIYDLCAKTGIPDAASEYLNRGMTVDQVKERLAEAPAIRDACAAAHVPDRAPSYIKAGHSLKEVRNLLFDVLKLRDVEINSKFSPEKANHRSVAIDYKEIFSHYGHARK